MGSFELVGTRYFPKKLGSYVGLCTGIVDAPSKFDNDKCLKWRWLLETFPEPGSEIGSPYINEETGRQWEVDKLTGTQLGSESANATKFTVAHLGRPLMAGEGQDPEALTASIVGTRAVLTIGPNSNGKITVTSVVALSEGMGPESQTQEV